jgi:hypothetical protein
MAPADAPGAIFFDLFVISLAPQILGASQMPHSQLLDF